MVRKIIGLLAAALVLVCCTQPALPVPDEGKEEPGPGPGPGPEPPPQPQEKTVQLTPAFQEDFSAQTSDWLDFIRHSGRPDFRCFPGFPSLSEKGNAILLLRLDPADPAGEGAGVQSRDFVHFGTYAVRMRCPDITAVQSRLTAVAELVLTDDDPVFGLDEIVLGVRLAEPRKVYTGVSRREAGETGDPAYTGDTAEPDLSGFNAGAKFYVYGFDWSAEKIVWWVKATPSAARTILAETTENVPQQPLRMGFRYHSTSGHPALYPYELEIDWMSYQPT